MLSPNPYLLHAQNNLSWPFMLNLPSHVHTLSNLQGTHLRDYEVTGKQTPLKQLPRSYSSSVNITVVGLGYHSVVIDHQAGGLSAGVDQQDGHL